MDSNCSYIDTEHEDHCEFYFVDEDLLQRVPWMFALLGGIYVVMGIIAVLLISDPPEELNNFTSLMGPQWEEENDNKEIAWTQVTSLRPKDVVKTTIFYQVR